MTIESNIAALVAASTKLTQSINVTRASVDGKRDSATTAEADITAAETAIAIAAGTATTAAANSAASLATAVADYTTQKTTKGLAAVQTSADTELKDRLHRRDPARHPFRGARPSLVMDFVRRECHRNNSAGNLEPVDLNTFMTFTRGSTATYVGPDGLIKTAGVNEARYGYDPVTGEALGLLIEEQRTNLVTYSRNLASGSWVRTGYSCETSSDCLAPDGSLSASKLVALTSEWLQCKRQVTVTPNTTYTFSFWINLSLSTRNGGYRVHDASNSVDIGSYLPYVGSDGWVRQTFTFTTASNCTEVNIYPHAYDALAGYKFYFWGIQLEAGSFPTSFIPTPATFTGRASTKTYFDSNGVMQTAAIGVAVTDYGYVDGRWVSKGLSLEGQATNLLRASTPNTGAAAGASTTAVWVENSAVLGLNAVSVSGADWVGIATPLGGNVSIAASVPYCFSLFSNKSTPLEMRINDQADYRTTTVVPLGENTFRHYVVGSVSTSLTTALHIRYANGHTVTGFQLEAGSYPTSYIHTTTAQVTRAADTSTSAQVTRAEDLAHLYAYNSANPDYFTVYSKAMINYVGGSTYPGIFRVDNAASANIGCYMADTSDSLAYKAGSYGLVPNGSSHSVGTVLAKSEFCCAMRQNKNTITGAYNGTFDAYTINAGMPLVHKHIYIGRYDFSLNGHIKQLTYFPRALSDADLQALTILED